MISNDSKLMQMLQTQMRYGAQRQGVLAHNIANADTPDYQAMDVKAPDFARMAAGHAGNAGGGLAMTQTSSKHLGGTLAGATAFAAMQDRNASEITPVGNNVVLEEQMAKISETGVQFQMSSSLMKKFTTMYRSVLGNR